MKNLIFITIVCCIIGGVDGQTVLTGNKDLNNGKTLQAVTVVHNCSR